MVDFKSDATIANTSGDLQKIIIMERRYNLNEAIYAYEKVMGKQEYTNDNDTYEMKARLLTLWREIASTIKRNMKEVDEYYMIQEQIYEANTYKEITDAYYIIDELLDKLNITRIDVKKTYNRLSVLEEAKAYGLN